MSVDTKVYVPRKNRSGIEFATELGQHLKEMFGKRFVGKFSIDINHTSDQTKHYQNYDYITLQFTLDYECDQFSDGKEHRMLHIFADYEQEMKRDFIMIDMGKWGHNIEISLAIINQYAGFVDVDDCDDVEIDYVRSKHDIKTYWKPIEH